MNQDHAARRRAVVVAGHTGDHTTIRAALVDEDPTVRAAALGAAARCGLLGAVDLTNAAIDPDASVRRRSAELIAASGESHHELLTRLLDDSDDSVVEVAAWACGEVVVDGNLIDRLVALATTADAALVRESAVAALGAIGDPRGLPAILAGCADKPAIRRRAVLALAPFAGPEVDAALERARTDRDWQVRQNAEDVAPMVSREPEAPSTAPHPTSP